LEIGGPEPELPVRDRLAIPSDHDQSGQVPPLLNASAVVVPEHLQARHAHPRCDFCMRGRTRIYTAPDRDAERCLST
jgi:glutaminase